MARLTSLRTVVLVLASVLAVVLVVSLVTVVVMVRRPLPSWSGSADLREVLDADVTVLRDERGVPQIWADSADDLFAAQGYVHAQDRFFEMDLRRHVTAGRLSELVGQNSDALGADRVVRTLGWRRVAEQEWALLEPTTRGYLQAYADGVNAYLADRSPSELSLAYTVLGLQVDLDRIEPWDPVDSLAWLKAMAWDLRGNYDSEMGRALAFGAIGDVNRVEQLWPAYPYDRHAPILGPVTDDAGGALAPASRADEARLTAAQPALEAVDRALATLPDLLGSGEGLGSNSWVVSGEHTTSGKPLLANDPHLGPSVPSVWYQVGLHCTEVGAECPFDVSGFGFSGLPGVVIGHNADIAWGFTNLGPDVTDFWLERVAGDTYLRDGQQLPLETRTEVIEVAGAPDVEIEIRSTVHGPILSDAVQPVAAVGSRAPVPEDSPVQGTGFEVALQWTALEPGRTAEAVFALNTASSWDEFRSAASLFEVPSQNLVYADTEGNIGYQAPGKIPVRPPGTAPGRADGTWPRPGWDSSWDWTGYVPFEDLPSVLNPEEGFVVTANQAVAGPDYPYVLTDDWAYGYRAQRIRDALTAATEGGAKVDADGMRALQLDSSNRFAPVLVPVLLAATLPVSESMSVEQRDFTRDAVELLRDWDYEQEPDSAAAAYFNAVWAELLDLTFSDELPVGTRPDGGDRWFEVVRVLLQERDSIWWDDQTTPTVLENRDQVIERALHNARLELTSRLGKDPERWEWGRLHSLHLEHSPLGGETVPDPVRALFNPDPVPLGGGTAIVNANGWDASTGSFRVTWVPSMRMVVDLGDLDASTWVDLTGISGHPWSGHYDDQLEVWAAGEQLAWPFTREAVEAAAEHRLTLRGGPAP
ncbi:MAG: penicillin acylase family protein [Actinomycetes bacterium]